MQALLSFERAPPFAAPLRFFLTAPLYAMAAGLLLVLDGPELLLSRWMPGALAATHLITLGFMLQIMLGALIQILPVVAGANLRHPLWVARIVHPGLNLGTLLLVAGFLWSLPWAMTMAALLLTLTLAVFLGAAVDALRGVPSTSPTIRGIKLALVGLAGVGGIGILMALSLAMGWSLPLLALADLHAGWGLAAWVGVLLAAVSYVVVPMFQLTPGYPAAAGWRFPVAILLLAVLWAVAVIIEQVWLQQLAQLALAMTGLAFVMLTLRLQGLRRRARADVTYRYWQLGLLAAILALLMLSTAAVRPDIAVTASWTLIFGILILGAVLAFIVGMLYKIIPFLGWLHLQNAGQAKVPAPPMNKLLSERAADRQFQTWAVAWLVLVLAPLQPEWLARLAGFAFLLANGWLFFNLGSAWLTYRRHLRHIHSRLAGT